MKTDRKKLAPDEGETVYLFCDGDQVEIEQMAPSYSSSEVVILCEREARELRDWLIAVLEQVAP
jgi:hypothetical protein